MIKLDKDEMIALHYLAREYGNCSIYDIYKIFGKQDSFSTLVTKLKSKEPNWGILLNSFDNSIRTTMSEYTSAMKCYIDCLSYHNGSFVIPSHVETQSQRCKDILQNLKALIAARDRVAKHDLAFIMDFKEEKNVSM